MKSKLLEFLKQDSVIIILLVLTAFLVRAYFLSNNAVLFFYDQARDAIISRSIIENGDLKIQGPSSSGSNDLLYHGVLYYYIISPFYVLSKGNPHFVSLISGFLNALTIIPLYLLALRMFSRKLVAVFSCLLFIFSTHSIHAGVWLSNPTLVPLFVTSFYYFLWRVVADKKFTYIPLVFLFLGLSNQAFLYTIYLWISIFVAGVLLIQERDPRWILLRQTLIGFVVYMISIGTMILAELRLVKTGLLNFASLSGFSESERPLFSTLSIAREAYSYGIKVAIFPNQLTFGLILLVISLLFLLKATRYTRIVIGMWLLSPLIMELITPRNDKHTLLGVTVVFYIIIAFALVHLLKTYAGKIAVIIILAAFLKINIDYSLYTKDVRISLFGIQRGAQLQDQLDLIDYTYLKANSRPFTISTYTNPYNINTTWAYLYYWYGATKYGYIPEYYGSDQAGRHGDTLMKLNPQYGDIHFTVYEPLEGLPGDFELEFAEIQTLQVRPVTEKKEFKILKLESRIK
ncbi:MAG: hypothetical protein M3Q44_00475 [bacterium]|nr:hypothetical protein [bacterium]